MLAFTATIHLVQLRYVYRMNILCVEILGRNSERLEQSGYYCTGCKIRLSFEVALVQMKSNLGALEIVF
jgi:hypothetical protein